ncbi:MAG: SLC45 family MFS transporter [Clostridiaceae bacterium]|nr:SLC45 family MFS transporter [Clostridiaceae bacterium]
MQRLNYRKTFLIGFGFFASSLAWSIYNAFVPVLLKERYLEDATIIGFIMTIDNVFGVIFQPLIGQLSDRTQTRIGKRMPYILAGIPLCAVAFFFIPRTNTLLSMMAVIILFNLIMSIWRSPVVALMPDLTPPSQRSKANGIINLMGGVGGVIAFLAGGLLAKAGGNNMPFLMGSIIMLFALIIIFFFVKEPDSRKLARQMESREAGLEQAKTAVRAEPPAEKPARLPKPQKRSLIALLLAIFFWFCGYNAVESFFTLYATQELGVVLGDASMMLTLFSLTLVAFALPAGILAGRFSRKKMILAGLAGMILTFLPMLFIENLWVLRILLLLGGAFWACININSLPMVVELASKERIGSFTGYYYFFSFSAAIVSPPLFGLICDLTKSYANLFIYSVIAFVLAMICMVNVHHGEADPNAAAPDNVQPITE